MLQYLSYQFVKHIVNLVCLFRNINILVIQVQAHEWHSKPLEYHIEHYYFHVMMRSSINSIWRQCTFYYKSNIFEYFLILCPTLASFIQNVRKY